MKLFGRVVHAKDGWPLECFKGRPVTNFIRLILHGNYYYTFGAGYQKAYVRDLPPPEGGFTFQAGRMLEPRDKDAYTTSGRAM